ncbi:Uma2 family endonuclease [Rhodoplanes sp. TEM]|nr:Uma2 family endonuclease [Rhodoplanes sp. TEM]MDQ0357448.1 Uma2 family endonuclease [Rhodoplanes tepidamans]
MDKATFLDWAGAREERYELVGGRVVMMIRPLIGHARIVRNLVRALDSRIDHQSLEVLADVAVDAGPHTIRAPDVIVVPLGVDSRAKVTAPPVLIAEVLSDSSVTIDLGDKAAEYLRLPSLLAYLVVAQDEPKVWFWVREGDRFSPGPHVVESLDAAVAISPLGLDLPMTDIFAGVHS